MAVAEVDTKQRILLAARDALIADGFAALSTRKVADAAAVPLSQIHYHLGTKEEMVLALLRAENDRLLARQAATFSEQLPLSERWIIACNYLDDDLNSGYVRVLHEMTAAGWSSEVVGTEVRQMLDGWTAVLTDVTARAEADGLVFGGLDVAEVVALVSAVFIGAESMILTGQEGATLPLRSALRSLGRLIARFEEGATS